MEEKLEISGKKKKELRSLSSMMGNLGYNKISYSKDRLNVEKYKGEDLKGKPNLEYTIVFGSNGITFTYAVPQESNKRKRLIELFPSFLDVIRVSEDYYDIKPTAILSQVKSVIDDISKVVDKEAVEIMTELEELKLRFNAITSKYNDLVRSSEENAKILIECERRRDELRVRVDELTGVSDATLKEDLYTWIKVHNGSIDVREFSKAHSLSIARIEEGLNHLVKDGYVKRRFD